jgi:hypothetical protein
MMGCNIMERYFSISHPPAVPDFPESKVKILNAKGIDPGPRKAHQS